MLKSACFESVSLNGPTGELAKKIVDNWLLGLDKRNPAMLDMFRDRDILPYRDLLPWSGEFAGKHITSGYYIWQITRDPRLLSEMTAFIDRLIACQDADGYLGCFSRECRLTGAFSQTPEKIGDTWDSWGHYHAMYGLLKWYEVTGRQDWWECVVRMAELFMNTFYNEKKPLVSIGWSEMNLAVMHVFALLYEKTGDVRYLEFAKNIEGDFSDPAAGDYMAYALGGMEFYQCPKPRWESMHVIMGIAEMYRATGDEKYLDAALKIFFSILKTDVHNTGAFSTDEQAVGNPYVNGRIETCCVLAYNALGCMLLEMTGDVRIADHLEKAHYNAVMGYFSPEGAWSTYDTPMDGQKIANYQDIVFQSRAGSPLLNCCSVNAPRGIGQLCEWAFMKNDDEIRIHFYEACCVELEDGTKIEISGRYPYEGRVGLRVDTCGRKVKLLLRIPEWSGRTLLTFRGETVVCEKGYRAVAGVFSAEEELLLEFDCSLRVEEGAMDCTGKASLFAGPLLFGFNASFNPGQNIDELSGWTKDELLSGVSCMHDDGSMRITLRDGTVLCDFYHLGLTGCRYRTWLPLK